MPNITCGQIGIAKLVNNINPSKAGGPDKLPARFLKETAIEIVPMYTHIFTQSYKLGQLPTSWKSATICPLFKKGKRSLPENYRPVSLTAIPCKIFEHILVSHIWSHLTHLQPVPCFHGSDSYLLLPCCLINTAAGRRRCFPAA